MDRDLQHAIDQALARELAAAPTSIADSGDQKHPETTQKSPDDAMTQLAGRAEELERIGPLGTGPAPDLQLGPDLAGQEQPPVTLGLQTAVLTAVSHNLAIRTAQLQPAITHEDVIAAEAVFDAVLFSNVDLTWTDQPQRVPVLMGNPLGTPFNSSTNYRFETGLRKRFEPGTEAFVSTDLVRLHNRSPGIAFFPDPGYTAAVRVGATQPLLRGFGTETNTATIRLSQNVQQRARHQLENDLLELVLKTETAYWDLDAAWRELAIAQWLLEQGEAVRDTMERRRNVDTIPAQYSDAVARVQQRKADVIRARRQIRLASDALKAIINDPQCPVASETVLHPIDQPLESPVACDLREAMVTAVDRRPELRQAALTIDDAAIRQRVADNQRLPLLNLTAQMAFWGLDGEPDQAYSETTSGDFIDYLLGLAFEWPLGNRAAEAISRQSRLQRSVALFDYQRTAQNVVLDVKNALRNVVTDFQLIRATRSFRIAQAENLRTLLVEEEFLAALTPEFLNLKFTRQETLAQARRQEVEALANFNKSLAALYRAMGTGLTMRQINVEPGQDQAAIR